MTSQHLGPDARFPLSSSSSTPPAEVPAGPPLQSAATLTGAHNNSLPTPPVDPRSIGDDPRPQPLGALSRPAEANGSGITTPSRSRRIGLAGAALTVAASLAAGGVGGWVAADLAADDTTVVAADATASTITTASLGDTGVLDVGAVVDLLDSSVVSVETIVETMVSGPGRSFAAQSSGAGTGVVIDADAGYILTNAHVVEDATEITVSLDGDDTARQATLIGYDTSADIAVLQVTDTDGLTSAALADTTAEVGDDVVAIGNALALEGSMSVTRGIVSAVDRSIETTSGTMTDLIQTDAAISSGNSGGPLVNAAGEVVGINTAVATSSSSVQASNIGFSITIDRALEVAETILGTAL